MTPATSAAAAAAGAEVVITMLPNGQILRSVAEQVIPAMQPGAVLCDCSTVDVDSARAVATPRDRRRAWARWMPPFRAASGARLRAR